MRFSLYPDIGALCFWFVKRYKLLASVFKVAFFFTDADIHAGVVSFFLTYNIE